ncbi:hypothetical protein A1O1_02643 [Capronia coronata CBS 617.96]|uniref:DNA-directed RNA polymerase III subunit RPC4 n=1 Tax=Capronia coronata CBS 617.96 TaxID=1182541 RepID=W9YX29_9EURO|nr:uncharacterized protein A1O1_02643 [Capronia coronata CBS 617.96]EXJ94250.1 hypothetical protein A1O1_02643 [Capronia coronata CBS 617.96]
MPDAPAATPKPAGAKPSTTGPKPKPRAGVVRKTKAEREQFAKEEAERQKARLAEEAKNERTRGGARGGRGGAGARGGRGGASAAGPRDDRARDGPMGVGGGVFGAGSGLKPGGRPRGMLAEGHSEVLDGQAALKFDESGGGELAGSSGGGGGGGRGAAAGSRKAGDTYEIPSDDDPDEPKRDIERIWISSEEEEEEDQGPVSSKGKQRATPRTFKASLALRPVRAPRMRREDEEENANTVSGKKRGTLKKNEESVDAHELPEDGDAMDVDVDVGVDDPVFVKEQPSSPEMRKRNLKKPRSLSGRARDLKLAAETIEERAERLRVSDDTHKLRNLFTGHQAGKPDPTSQDADESEEDSGIEDGKLFLFQLPPLTPFLLDEESMNHEPAVKAEPNADTTVPPSGITVSIPSAVKKDPETDAVADPSLPHLLMDGMLTASEPTRLPSGLVGKLRLHKSGKVSLDWGGTDIEVQYGSEVDFLQDVVMVSPGVKAEGQGQENGDADEAGATNKGKVPGTAYALGHVRKKLVLIPDWAKLYD